jgi:hypothetical protein
MHFQAGRISAEEAIDKSKNPGAMVDKMQRNGISVNKADDALLAEAEEQRGGDDSKKAPGQAAGQGSDADRNAQIAANRARLAALAGKK